MKNLIMLLIFRIIFSVYQNDGTSYSSSTKISPNSDLHLLRISKTTNISGSAPNPDFEFEIPFRPIQTMEKRKYLLMDIVMPVNF